MTESPANKLSERIRNLDATSARDKLLSAEDSDVAAALAELRPGQAVDILEHFSPERREAIAAAAPVGEGEQWRVRSRYPESTVGRLMDPMPLRFTPDTTVGAATNALRDTVKSKLITYLFIIEPGGRLVGVVTFREMLYADRDQR